MRVVLLCVVGLLAVAAVPTPKDETNFISAAVAASDEYQIGVGKHDITGPIGGKISGFDVPETSDSLLTRMFARAFVVYQGDQVPTVFAVCERWIVSNYIYNLVLEGVQAVDPRIDRNHLILTATHVHSASSVWAQYGILQLSSADFPAGLSEKLYAAGVVAAVTEALEMAKATTGKLSHHTVENANNPDIAIQRAPNAFARNPNPGFPTAESERLDGRMTLLKFTKSNGEPIGMINWFNVQGTSLDADSKVLSSGNKGTAALMFERAMAAEGHTGFVAAFANGGFADATPNIWGPHCENEPFVDQTCDFRVKEVYDNSSKVITFLAPEATCGGHYNKCQAKGPLFPDNRDENLNQIETGRRQFLRAKEAWDLPETEWKTVTGGVKSTTTYFNLRTMEPRCGAAVGFSYLSGSVDGTVVDTRVLNLNSSESVDSIPTDGSVDSKLIRAAIEMVSDLMIGKYSKETAECQAPKNILGAEDPGVRVFFGSLLSCSLISIGEGKESFSIASTPAIPSATSAWQMEQALLEAKGEDGGRVVITSPANDYVGYAVTEDEYKEQRFEGAATIGGPQTANKLSRQLVATAKCQKDGSCPAHLAVDAAECLAQFPADNCPPPFNKEASSNLNSVAHMGIDFGKQNGWVEDAADYSAATDTNRGSFVNGTAKSTDVSASAQFLTTGKFSLANVPLTMAEVLCKKGEDWESVATEADYETIIRLSKEGTNLVATFTWTIPSTFNSDSAFSECKLVYHTYNESGEDKKSGEAPSFSVVKPSP